MVLELELAVLVVLMIILVLGVLGILAETYFSRQGRKDALNSMERAVRRQEMADKRDWIRISENWNKTRES